MLDTGLDSDSIRVCFDRVLYWLGSLHLGFLILGLKSESLVTSLMFESFWGKDFYFQDMCGLLTILFLFIHTVWFLVVLMKFGRNSVVHTHKFKLLVWASLLISCNCQHFFSTAR